MRLLLTSAGIKNTSIGDALIDLLGKPISESTALVVPTAAEVIQLSLAVVVLDDGQTAALTGAERELRADAGQACLFEFRMHRCYLPSASVGTPKSLRPSTFDSFIRTTPIVAVSRT